MTGVFLLNRRPWEEAASGNHRPASRRSSVTRPHRAGQEGGFAVPRFNDVDDAPPVQNAAVPEAEALALYPWAASRIAALEGGFPGALRPQVPRRGILVVPDPNLNVIHPVVAIPALEGRLEPGTAFLACAVWAGDGAPAGSGAAVPGGSLLPKAAVQEKDPGHWDLTIFDRSGGIAAQIAI
ncbi:MAG: hypothetical protein LBK63_11600 [Treponema sp.]|nr:hypothetical protein [Treponema sp.]